MKTSQVIQNRKDFVAQKLIGTMPEQVLSTLAFRPNSDSQRFR